MQDIVSQAAKAWLDMAQAAVLDKQDEFMAGLEDVWQEDPSAGQEGCQYWEQIGKLFAGCRFMIENWEHYERTIDRLLSFCRQHECYEAVSSDFDAWLEAWSNASDPQDPAFRVYVDFKKAGVGAVDQIVKWRIAFDDLQDAYISRINSRRELERLQEKLVQLMQRYNAYACCHAPLPALDMVDDGAPSRRFVSP